MSEALEQIRRQAATAVDELLTVARLQPGDILVVGCSSSEILGEKIGTGSSMEAARASSKQVLGKQGRETVKVTPFSSRDCWVASRPPSSHMRYCPARMSVFWASSSGTMRGRLKPDSSRSLKGSG